MAEPSVRAGDVIDHVVVLMMENHSFDHILGYTHGRLAENRMADPSALRRSISHVRLPHLASTTPE
jgi:phospholipase C